MIPDSVTSIKVSAFAYCTSLRVLKFGNGITKINYNTGSQSAYETTGSSTVTEVTYYENPFAGCSALVGLEFGTNTLSAFKMSNFSAATRMGYVYFSGKLPTSVTGTMPGVAARACYVSHEEYPNGLPQATWAGAPVRYLEGKLPSEVEPYDLTFLSPPSGDSGLVAYYKFNGDVKDSSGYGNDGAVQGVTLTVDRHGNTNSAYYFDGASCVEVPNSSSLKGVVKTVTCSVWIKPEAWDAVYGGWMPILCKGTSIPRNIGFQFRESWGLEMISDTSYRQNGDPGAYLALPQPLSLNEWQMLTYTSDGSTVKLYLNGYFSFHMYIPHFQGNLSK